MHTTHRRLQLVASAEVGVHELVAVEGQVLDAQHAKVQRCHHWEVQRERV